MTFIKLFVVLVSFLLLWPTSVHAYIDPGTGSMVLQMIVAGVMAGLYLCKRYWNKIKLLIGHVRNRDGTAEMPPDGPSQEDA
jgi:hypothetical protein